MVAANQSQTTAVLVSPLSSPAVSPPSTPVASPSAVVHNPGWCDNYEVPWNSLPKDVLDQLKQDNRLSPTLMRKFVRCIASDILTVCMKPRRKETAIVARNIVAKFKESLQDRLNGDVVGNGYEGLLNSVQTRIENATRNNSDIPRKRRRKSLDMSKASEGQDNRPPKMDSYGCMKWQPSLGEDQTEETQESLKKELQQLFATTAQKDWDRTKIKELVICTFPTQRKDINSGMEVTDLVKEWPFLFHFVLTHFEELVGFPLLTALLTAASSKAAIMRKYFMSATLPNTKINQRVTAMLEETKTFLVQPTPVLELAVGVQLLLTYFGEKAEALFYLAQVCICL